MKATPKQEILRALALRGAFGDLEDAASQGDVPAGDASDFERYARRKARELRARAEKLLETLEDPNAPDREREDLLEELNDIQGKLEKIWRALRA